MREVHASSVGERIRFHRKASQKTQAVVAGLAGITEDYLSQVERGLKVPSFGTLQRIADVLRVPAASLISSQAADPIVMPSTGLAAVRRAMTTPWLNPRTGESPDVEQLRSWVDLAWSRWQRSAQRYTDTTNLLPGLVADVDAAMRANHTNDSDEERRAYEVASDLQFLLRTFCRRTGQLDLTLLAADRGLRIATDVGDHRRIAAAHWNLCHALLATDDPENARSVAVDAIQRLDRWADGTDLDAMALHGALYLVAAESTARRGDAESAHGYLDEARRLALLVGERNVCWTAFGPTNVAIHAVNIELNLGQVRAALTAGDHVDTGRVASVERRLTFLLERAECHGRRNEDGAVLDNLLRAEQVAAEDLRHNAIARDLVAGLMTRTRRSAAPSVRRLANRMGLIPT